MKDMLVRLLELPDVQDTENSLGKKGVVFRRPIPPEKSFVVDWVFEHFGEYWKNEVETAFSSLPVRCFIAQQGHEILGFACFETSAKNFFGPTGTKESERGKGIGKVLLIKSLEAMKDMGYTYAIIGGVGPAAFYEAAVGAQLIPGSEVSIYQHLIRKKP
jgi:GNAT superfamily N-acetyltransferase